MGSTSSGHRASPRPIRTPADAEWGIAPADRTPSASVEPWELEDDPGPAFWGRRRPDPAAMSLHDRLRDREAKSAAPLPSSAGGVGSVKPVEDQLALARRDSRAVVVDGDSDPLAPGAGRDADDTVLGRVLDCVLDEVV